MSVDLRSLVTLTLRSPADAARVIAGMNFPREAGWMALMVASILNTIAYFINLSMINLPAELNLAIFTSPVMYLVLSFALSVIGVFGVFWTGQMLEGQARFPELLALIAWLVFLHALSNFVFLGLLILIPLLASLFSLGAMIYGIWILVNFVRVAHRFATIGKAVMTIALTLVGLIIGLSVFLSVIGVTAMGIS